MGQHRATPSQTVEAEAKCVACGHKQWFGPGEIPKGEQPQCGQCYSPMVSTGRAKTRHRRS